MRADLKYLGILSFPLKAIVAENFAVTDFSYGGKGCLGKKVKCLLCKHTT